MFLDSNLSLVKRKSKPMKYTCTVLINAPLDTTVALWKDETYFKEWQDGFKSIEHLSGTPNTKGATSKILFQGKKEMELLETIILSNLPEEKSALYEHIHMTNTQTTNFKAVGENQTAYTATLEYTKFNGFMVTVMAKLFPSKFKAQSQKWMNQFKAFAEKKA